MSKDNNMKKKSQTYSNNIKNRGNVSKSLSKKENKFTVGPCVLGLLLFLIVGSALF
jgi:hypothetical protein